MQSGNLFQGNNTHVLVNYQSIMVKMRFGKGVSWRIGGSRLLFANVCQIFSRGPTHVTSWIRRRIILHNEIFSLAFKISLVLSLLNHFLKRKTLDKIRFGVNREIFAFWPETQICCIYFQWKTLQYDLGNDRQFSTSRNILV